MALSAPKIQRHRLSSFAAACLLLAITCSPSGAQERPKVQGHPQVQAGPVLPSFGAVYDVDEPDFPTPTDSTYKVIFDVGQSPESATASNPRIETLARFLNMHAQAGVAQEKMKLVLVLHGSAARAALSDTAYRARFATANPDSPLIAALADVGVEIYLCGQSAAHRGFARDDLAEDVGLALSAMTVLVTRQAEGYQLIAF
jgi:intracellular sulfur oxidation DsrE/DsrF family protein